MAPASKTGVDLNVCHTRATVTALLEFLYKLMALHLVYILLPSYVVREGTQR